jgi:DNA-binding response OmpR family regulator
MTEGNPLRMTRILVVEDEPGIALGLRNDLTLEGYAVEVAGDGETALERGRAGGFDLILLDVMLPRKDGFAVCRELRRAGVKSSVILLTARAQEAEKVLGLELGADDYVTKPFSPLELCARIKAVLRRTASEQPKVSRFGEIEVDFERCLARRAGTPVDLTPLEFKVLAALIEAHGRLLSRDRLIERVWGKGVSITDRVVDNHILNLRRKLEATPAEPRYLLSVRGLGYRFGDPAENLTET